MTDCTLRGICSRDGGLIQTGPFGSQLHQSDYTETGVPVVMPKDIVHGRVATEGIACISERKANELSRHFLRAGSIAMPRRGDIGKRAFINQEQAGFLCGTGCIQIVVPIEVMKPRYLYYFLGQRHVVEWLERNAIGTTMLNLNTKIIGGVQIPSVSIESQTRIAEILTAYDDLIENNRRRMQLLEQSARLLFKEWFVHLRFKGHEHVKVLDRVPEGWDRKALREVAESVIYGYTASSSVHPIGPKFVRITDIVPDVIDWASVPFCSISEKEIRKYSLKPGDVVVARTGATVGYAKRIGALPADSVFASYLVRFRFSEELDDVLAGIFMESPEYKSFVRNNAGGAAQPNANATVLSAAKLLIPPRHLQREFREFVEPLNRQKDLLLTQNQKLRQARDLLLPRLMNGEIAV